MKLLAPTFADWLLDQLGRRFSTKHGQPSFSLKLLANTLSFLLSWGLIFIAWMLLGSERSLPVVLGGAVMGSLLYGVLTARLRPSNL
ncbi:hypothetical protein [Stenotrophomonas rhizophila]|uniref:hypothetical protein n=1 Tax=Stenotrophomonas rhizophila TaxID=216778 RepID=UPI001E59C5AD|nr:hypothetical protein [Stenotrophomonas rhizophila]MCC7634779.1 hypothetical protein [Stenotrophomonas rhizophila]MCC7665167.1 hypothetical protein [Stenotrophomonas rhizophila]